MNRPISSADNTGNPFLVVLAVGLILLLAIFLWSFNAWKQNRDEHIIVFKPSACESLRQAGLNLNKSDDGCTVNAYAEAGVLSDSYDVWFEIKGDRKHMSVPNEWMIAKFDK